MNRLLLISLFSLTASMVFAGSLYVDDNAPGDPSPGNPLVSDPAEDGSQAHPFDAIQKAIDFIADPNVLNEVIILPGTYTGDGNRDIDFKGKPITVRGSDPDDPNVVAATVIDCQGTEAQPHRGFYFHTNETESSVLKGLTITNGYGLSEADLFDGSSNSYIVGGGIFCRTASPKLEGVVVSNSKADRGGGIFTTMSNPHLVRCMFLENTADAGGGVYFYRGNAYLDGCTISNNYTTILGGAGYLIQGMVSIKHCDIAGNKSDLGGAFYIYMSEIVLEDSIIRANVADSLGGGIYLKYSSSGVEFRNCLFSGNYSNSNGGGMYVIGANPVITECTIVGNRAERNGGGIYGSVSAEITVTNSIFRQNTARLHGNHVSLAYEPGEDPDGRSLSVRYCVIGGGTPPININVDPLFADPGHWDDNGTPGDWSDDTWIDGDYHLKSYAGRWEPVSENWVTDDVHSPCIDAGDPEADYSTEPPYNGGRINMGAYGGTEYASKTPNCPEPPIGDLDDDCKVTFADLALFAANWQACNLDPPSACE